MVRQVDGNVYSIGGWKSEGKLALMAMWIMFYTFTMTMHPWNCAEYNMQDINLAFKEVLLFDPSVEE